MERRKGIRRRTAAAIAAGCLFTQIFAPVTALADTAKVDVDETMYVNLSYYGAVDKVNVVKGLTFNGVTEYTDYGNYSKVQNMSTDAEPVLGDGSVTWAAPSDSNKFFFEGTMTPEETQLPWTFDVTYKLNGVVTDAEQLAGASGLVEMDIDAYPNDAVDEYMKNNMMLFAMVPVDMSKNYSVDAPGSQMQTIGEITGVVFTALPGEEQHFVVRIGSDSFETIGAVMMMMPGTVSALDNIKDLNEAKNTFRGDVDAVMSDMETMMGNVTDMQSQLDLMNQVLNSLESAKDTVQTAADSIFAGADVSIADLQALSADMTPIDTFLRTAQWLTYDLNQTMNETNQDVLDLSNRLNRVTKSLRRLASSMDGADVDTGALSEDLKGLQASLQAVTDRLSGQQDKLDQYITKIDEALAGLGSGAGSGLAQSVLAGLRQQIEGIKGTIQGLIDKLNAVSGGAGDVESLAKNLSGALNDLSDDGASTSFQLAGLMNVARNLLGDMDTLNTVLNSYYPDIQTALEASSTLVTQLQTASQDLAGLLTTVNDTLKNVRPAADAAANQSIALGREASQNSQKMLETTESMKNSTSNLHSTIDGELDEKEKDSNFLNMDPDAAKLSLTSSENQEPNSIQIVCRTAEISVDDNAQEVLDAEQAAEDNLGPLGRILLVLKKIVKAVADVLSGI